MIVSSEFIVSLITTVNFHIFFSLFTGSGVGDTNQHQDRQSAINDSGFSANELMEKKKKNSKASEAHKHAHVSY